MTTTQPPTQESTPITEADGAIDPAKIVYRTFESEEDLQIIIKMMEIQLSEPYPIYTYRYFVQKWPELTFLAYYEGEFIGCCVSKLEDQEKPADGAVRYRGYIAMLAVDPTKRRCGLGRRLVNMTIAKMREMGADEVILETEITNLAALNLYQQLGFLRDKRLQSYYLNGNDAYKLKLLFN